MDENGEGVAVPEEKAGSVEPAKDRIRRPQRAPGPEILKKRTNCYFWARRIQAKQEKQEKQEAARHDRNRGHYHAVPYDYGDDDDKEGNNVAKKKANH